jgi:hypothetical protein
VIIKYLFNVLGTQSPHGCQLTQSRGSGRGSSIERNKRARHRATAARNNQQSHDTGGSLTLRVTLGVLSSSDAADSDAAALTAACRLR